MKSKTNKFKLTVSIKIILGLIILTLPACSWFGQKPSEEDFSNATAEVFCLAQKNIQNKDFTKDANEQAWAIYEKYGILKNKNYDEFEEKMKNYDKKLMELIESKIRALNCADENAIKQYFTPIDDLSDSK